jgi:hypothetical protein
MQPVLSPIEASSSISSAESVIAGNVASSLIFSSIGLASLPHSWNHRGNDAVHRCVTEIPNARQLEGCKSMALGDVEHPVELFRAASTHPAGRKVR